MNPKEIIARRAAQELNYGDVVNLGIGLPTMISDYITDDHDHDGIGKFIEKYIL